MIGSCGDGFAPLEQCTFLDARIRPMHDDPGVGSTAPHHFTEEDISFRFLTYMFQSQLYSLISDARSCSKNLDGWDALGL